MRKHIFACLTIAFVLSFGVLGSAQAHAKVSSSDPAAGAKLTKVPTKVTLVFTEEVSAKANESLFTVVDERGAVVGNGKLDTTDIDHKTLSGALNSGLGDGVYTVKWQVVTPDDDAHSEGSFSFGVNKAPGPQPTAAPAHEETATPAAPAAGGSSSPAGSTGPNTLPHTGGETSSSAIWGVVGMAMLGVGWLMVRRIGARR